MSKAIRRVYVEDSSGFTLGMDNVTPVTFIFSNRLPKTAYTSFSIEPLADNPKVQEWIQSLSDKRIIMSMNDLARKLLEVSRL